MAPVKFGLFKTRSRDHQEQPSTENLLQSSTSGDLAVSMSTPSSPVPSTSKEHLEDPPADMSVLQLGIEDEDVVSDNRTPKRRVSESIRLEIGQMNYQPLNNQTSTDDTSISNLDLDDDFNQSDDSKDVQNTTLALDVDGDGASTSCDANSLQFDVTSLAASEDLSIHCGPMKRPKKTRSKEENRQLRDFYMWRASNVEVMQNLLSRSGTQDEQIKWEAIATSRGLCTLTDSCACGDCVRAKFLAGVTDGDGGLGAAPVLNAMSIGCSVQ